MREEKRKTELHGLKLNRFSICTMAAACILIIGALAITFIMSANHQKMNTHVTDYTELSKQAEIVGNASDYLTEQVRLLVMTGDMYYAEQYFKEVNETRRRENALEAMQQHNLAGGWSSRMTKAVETSDALMVREIYAMKLIALAYDYDEDELPEEIRAAVPDPGDAKLNSADKIEKARGMVFDNEYQYTKAVIHEHLTVFTQGILLATEDDIAADMAELSNTILVQRMLMIIMAAVIVLVFIVIHCGVVKPLRRLASGEDPEKIRCVYELRSLLKAYQEKTDTVDGGDMTRDAQTL